MNILDYLEGHKFRKISDRIFCLQNSTHNNIRQSTIDILKPLANDLHDQLDTYKLKNLIYYVSYGYEHCHYNETIELKKYSQQYKLTTESDTIMMVIYAGYIETKDWSKHRAYGFNKSQSDKGTTIDRVILKDTYDTFNQNKIHQHRDNIDKIDKLHEPLITKIDDKYSKLRDLIYERSDKQKAPIQKDIKRSQLKDELAIKKLVKAKDNYKEIIDNETYRFSKGYKPLQPYKDDNDEE